MIFSFWEMMDRAANGGVNGYLGRTHNENKKKPSSIKIADIFIKDPKSVVSLNDLDPEDDNHFWSLVVVFNQRRKGSEYMRYECNKQEAI